MEMMLVLGIIALLLGFGSYAMVGTMDRAERGKVEADFKALTTALIEYKTVTRRYPSTAQGLDALVNRPTSAPKPKRWERIMRPDGIVDPWGNPYEYTYPGKHNPTDYDIFSVGKDGQPNTEDDLGNWDS